MLQFWTEMTPLHLPLICLSQPSSFVCYSFVHQLLPKFCLPRRHHHRTGLHPLEDVLDSRRRNHMYQTVLRLLFPPSFQHHDQHQRHSLTELHQRELSVFAAFVVLGALRPVARPHDSPQMLLKLKHPHLNLCHYG